MRFLLANVGWDHGDMFVSKEGGCVIRSWLKQLINQLVLEPTKLLPIK